MRTLLAIFSLLFVSDAFAQRTTTQHIPQTNYYTGSKMYCEYENTKSKRLHSDGLYSFLNKNYNNAYTTFKEILETEKQSCDAWFFAGRALLLQNRYNEALPYLHIADSLSNNRSVEIKSTLAHAALTLGDALLAREKYIELMDLYPDSRQLIHSYLGIAETALLIGDFKYGLENTDLAIQKLGSRKTPAVYYVKAQLLHLNEEPEKALPYFKKSKSKYGDDDKFKIYYAYCLFKTAETNDNKRMKKQSEKIYKQIKNKTLIPEIVKETLVF